MFDSFAILLLVFILISGFLLVFLLTFVNKIQQKLITIYQAHKREMFEYLQDKEEEKLIVFLGDSITDAFPVSEMFLHHNIINRGISGDTTEGVLKRLKYSVLNLKPWKVFLLIGTNDLAERGSRIEIIGENVRKIIIQIQEECPETQIFLQSLLPINRNKASKFIAQYILRHRTNTRINQTNQYFQKIAEDTGVQYLDIHQAFINSKGELQENLTLEGLHLSGKGYLALAKQLSPFLTNHNIT